MFEKIIFQNIISNEKYGVCFIPFLKKEYFQLAESKVIFNHISEYFTSFKTVPHHNEVAISIGNDTSLSEDMFAKTISLIDEIKTPDDYNFEWLESETKKWIRNKAFEQVIVESAERLGSNKPIDDMMDKVKDVFSINFNESIGNSFFKDYERQHDFYTQKKEKFESSLSVFNTCCDGGVERKTLNVLMAPTNTGKTSGLVSLASSYLRRGYNVLYITCEMSEENIRQRIDANFLRLPINDVPRLPRELYCKRMKEFSTCYKTNLYVKEYPTAVANVNHIRALLDSLATKEKFIPDIVIVDYLNIMTSTRIKSASLYETAKAIAEELRGLAVQSNMCFWSATQTNRGGDGASDLDSTDCSDSYGTPMTVDCMVAIIQTQALLEQGRQIWKITKTRYSAMKGYKFGVKHDFETCTVSDDDTPREDNTDENNKKFTKVNTEERMNSIGIDFE
jgi:archaellum biogenesis ATPase FlaH